MSQKLRSYGSRLLHIKESSWVSPPPAAKVRFHRSKAQNSQSSYSRNGGGGVKRHQSLPGADFSAHTRPEHIAKGRESIDLVVCVCNNEENDNNSEGLAYGVNNEDELFAENAENEDMSPISSSPGNVLTVSSDGCTIYCPESDLTNLADFSFDEVFPASSTAAKIFANRIAPLTPHVARGGHAAVVIDGTSAAGKINMTLGQFSERQDFDDDEDNENGDDDDNNNNNNNNNNNEAITENDLGLVHFAVNQIISHLGKSMEQQHEHRQEPLLTLTWYELCGRHGVRDIFASAASDDEGHGPTKGMQLVDDPGAGLHVPGLLEVAVQSVGDVHRILQHIREAENHDSSAKKRRH